MSYRDIYGPLSSVVPRLVAKRYKRPLVVAVVGSVLMESVLLVIYGIVLYPEGSLFIKALWTIVFCGFGMGAAIGVIIVLFVVDQLTGRKAIAATAVITVFTLGIGCNLLCFMLDANYFNFFGGREALLSFVVSGLMLSVIGGFGLGWLLFSRRGQSLFNHLFEVPIDD